MDFPGVVLFFNYLPIYPFETGNGCGWMEPVWGGTRGSGAEGVREEREKGGAGESGFHPGKAPGRGRRQTRAAGIPGELLRRVVRKKRIPPVVTRV